MVPAIILKPRPSAHAPPDNQSAAPHRRTELAAGVAADHDRAVGHPSLAAGIRRADAIPGAAHDLNQAPAHFAAGKIAGIAFDL